MRRRAFLKGLGLSTVAAAAASLPIPAEPKPAPPPLPKPGPKLRRLPFEQSLYFSTEFGAVQVIQGREDFCGSCRGKPLPRGTCICGREGE